MRRFTRITLYGVFVVTLVMVSAASGTTIVWEEPEEVIKRAPIIVHARVADVETKWDQSSQRLYDDVTLDILKVLKGSVPSRIVIRRWGVIRLVPAYTPGEEIVLCIYMSRFGYYKPMGLQNGIFRIKQGKVAGSNLSVSDLKQQIKELIADQRSGLSPDVPRPRLPEDSDELNYWHLS